jgi:hypothetical protein
MNTIEEYLKNSKNANLKIFGFSAFSFHAVSGFGWFRFFGLGLHWKNTLKHRLYFSERNGYKKNYNIGNWNISFIS